MSELPPEAVPAELFCVAGWTSKAVLEHEEFLFQQHEVGAIQLYDRGRIVTGEGPPLLRWRMSWYRGNELVHAAVVMFEEEDAAKLWFAAYCDLGWGWSVPNPLDRVGLHRYPIVDPASGLPTTGSRMAATPEEIIAVAEDRQADVPVLVHHVDPGDVSQGAESFRDATFGAVAMVFVGDDLAQRLSGELSPESHIPEHGARLYLPAWWHQREADLLLERSDAAQRWRDITAAAVRAARWRPAGAMPMEKEMWQVYISGAWNDERVVLRPGESDRWPDRQDPVDKQRLRRRIQGAGENITEQRERLMRQEQTRADLDRDIARGNATLAALTSSRRRLAQGVLRLRAERDSALARLAETSIGVAMSRKHEANRLARARARELMDSEADLEALSRKANQIEPDFREKTLTEVLSDAATLSGIRLGPGISSDVDGVTDVRLRRCRTVLELLNGYRGGSLHEHLIHGGISPLLIGSTDAAAAVTFPVPGLGWTRFPDYIRLDHSSNPAIVLHYYVDSGGIAHIGYIGRTLCGDIT